MNARLLIAVALVLCAVAVRGDDTEQSELAGVETVEPMFLEAAADSESSPLFQLPKKLRKTTVEPRYYGESARKPKKYVSPEYRDPQPVKKHNHRHHKNKPVLFTSHYFSPLPKKLNGKKLRVSRQKRGRLLVPFRATVETPIGHRRHQKGYTQAELWDGRLPNKFDDPRQNMKKTKAPAPQMTLLESMAAVQDGMEEDTTDALEAEAEGPVPPPFQHDEGEQQATVVESAEQFYDGNFMAPSWADEEATESELSAIEAGAEVEMTAAEKAAAQATKLHLAAFAGVQLDKSKLPRLVPVVPHVNADEALEQYNDLEAFLQQAEAQTASFVEVAAEDEEEEEEADEEEAEEETEDEAEDESEEEADEESEEEADEEEAEFALVETAAAADDSVDAEMDEMAQNEQAAAQVDMDATSDEASMSDAETDTVEEETVETEEAADADEMSSAEEADSAEEVVSEDEAVEEAEMADAASFVEEDAQAEADAVDTLLAEVDSHLSADSDSETETEQVVEANTGKGTPGASIAAGMTWEDAQTERLNAMEAQLAAEKAAAPKVAAAVVSSRAELTAVDADHQTPQYNSVEAEVETVEPELLVEASAQQVLKAKMQQLKAINRS